MGCGASSGAHAGGRGSGGRGNGPGARTQAPIRPSNDPLTKPANYRHGGEITQPMLNNQRAEFWATRVEGSNQIWGALRTSCEALLVNDIPLANAIIEASNITRLGSSLEVVVDETGRQYKVPLYCMSNPIELFGAAGAGGASAVNTDQQQQKQMNSGKDTATSKDNTTLGLGGGPYTDLRIKINPGDHNIVVKADMGNNVGAFKTLISTKQEEAASLKDINLSVERQRLFLAGKELKDHVIMSATGVDAGKVVQVFLRNDSTAAAPTAASA